MTREEAIKRLKEYAPYSYGIWHNDEEDTKAFDMAIEALSRPQGEWQKVDSQPYFRKHYDNVCCSVCHHKGMRKYNYCPNCGAMMTPYKGGDDK